MQMKNCDPKADLSNDAQAIIEALLPFEGAMVLELGCVRAEAARMIANEEAQLPEKGTHGG